VVGCAELVLPKSQDQADVMEAWSQKQKFFAAAAKCATDNGMIVLNQNGDGITFLANYFENANWTASLMNFQESLIKQFGETGVRIGVSMGPTAVGYINDDLSTFTALGPEVDLAVRLCRQSVENHMIVSTRVWYTLGESITGWSPRKTHFKVRGFERIIPCMLLESEPGLFQGAA
jgi:class 3 adenylate cyclase